VATTAAPDQGWESYLSQIQIHGAPPGQPTSIPSDIASVAPTARAADAPPAPMQASQHAVSDAPHAASAQADAPPAAFTLTVAQPAAFTQFSAPAVQPVQVAPAVADSHVSTETGGGARGSQTDSGGAAPPVDLMHYADYGWHIVPSVQNQYGEAAPASDEWIQFAGDLIPQDWFYA
jgi:hypothetical protein